MQRYWIAAIYSRTEDYKWAVYDRAIITAKNDLDAVKQVIAHSDVDEVLVSPLPTPPIVWD